MRIGACARLRRRAYAHSLAGTTEGDPMSRTPTDRTITPYDTGHRLRPQPLVEGWTCRPHSGPPRRAAADDFGRVTFTDDNGAAVLTLYLERTGSHGYLLRIEDLPDTHHLHAECI